MRTQCCTYEHPGDLWRRRHDMCMNALSFSFAGAAAIDRRMSSFWFCMNREGLMKKLDSRSGGFIHEQWMHGATSRFLRKGEVKPPGHRPSVPDFRVAKQIQGPYTRFLTHRSCSSYSNVLSRSKLQRAWSSKEQLFAGRHAEVICVESCAFKSHTREWRL
jgi:hypothetical protein